MKYFNSKIILGLALLPSLFVLSACNVDEDGSATTTNEATTGGTGVGDGISISEASDLIPDSDNINLDQAFSVRVVNAGSAVDNAVVTLSLTPTGFFKGFYSVASADAEAYSRTLTAVCPAEVSGTDTNANGNIDPSGYAVITQHPTLAPTVSNDVAITNSSGEAYFSLRYGREVATWATFTITATTVIEGALVTAVVEDFVPEQLADEVTDTETSFAGQDSPFGTSASCGDIM